MAHSNGKAPAKKSPTKSLNGQVIPRPNGRGALRHGSLPGNTPGTGRPRDEVRQSLLELATGKGVPFLDNLLDGRVRIRLVQICEHCGKKAKNAHTPAEIEEVINSVRVSIDQRLKGLDQTLRYGLGTKDELDIRSHPDVQKFIAVHAQATREIAGDEAYKRISERIQELAA